MRKINVEIKHYIGKTYTQDSIKSTITEFLKELLSVDNVFLLPRHTSMEENTNQDSTIVQTRNIYQIIQDLDIYLLELHETNNSIYYQISIESDSSVYDVAGNKYILR